MNEFIQAWNTGLLFPKLLLVSYLILPITICFLGYKLENTK